MFVDKVEVNVQAGNGGDGKLSFRHEKFIQKGGPDGGDGGDGGNVILLASRNQDSLAAFRYKKLVKAENGLAGGKAKKHGKNGEDLIVPVPVGTVVLLPDADVLADLVDDEQQIVIAKGGKGGYGNAHFTSSRRQAPRIAENGELGEHKVLTFELKMIADVGLVGLPNAGKSTLLARISNAHPEIADYPFTTLHPNLGVADIAERSLLFADIPGLISGASQGKGLGDEFLRHIERTPVLVHLVDAYEDVDSAFQTIQSELKAYKFDLTQRPQLIVLNKIDGFDSKSKNKKIQQLKKVAPRGTKILAISAKSGEGVKELLYQASAMVDKERRKAAKQIKLTDSMPVFRLAKDEASWTVTKTKGGYRVAGVKIERFASRTDFTSDPAVARLRDIMQKMGIIHELQRKGAEPGNVITIASASFIY